MQTTQTENHTAMVGPRTPEELLARFSEYVGRGDLDGLMRLYEPCAVFMPEPTVILKDGEAIRGALAQMLALAPTMEMKVTEVLDTDGIALVVVEWAMRATAPDGTAVHRSGRSADVLRRQSDGTWRVLVDHP